MYSYHFLKLAMAIAESDHASRECAPAGPGVSDGNINFASPSFPEPGKSQNESPVFSLQDFRILLLNAQATKNVSLHITRKRCRY